MIRIIPVVEIDFDPALRLQTEVGQYGREEPDQAGKVVHDDLAKQIGIAGIVWRVARGKHGMA